MYVSDCRLSILCVNRTLIASSLCWCGTSVCVTVSVPLCMCVSRSGIHPCVLWTLCASTLADISKRRRSGEAVRQDIPSLSYRLPLLLCTHTEILPHPVLLFLLLSLSSLPCFLPYNFTFIRSFSFYSPVASSRLLSWRLLHPVLTRSLFLHLLFSVTPALVIFSSLLCHVHACLIFRTTCFFSSTQKQKRQNKRSQEGVGDNREWVKVRPHAICLVEWEPFLIKYKAF